MTDVGNLAATQNLNLASGATFTWGLTVTENAVAKPWAGVTLSSAIVDKSTNLTLTTRLRRRTSIGDTTHRVAGGSRVPRQRRG